MPRGIPKIRREKKVEPKQPLVDLGAFEKSGRIEELQQEMTGDGLESPPDLPTFKKWFRVQAEHSLYFFVKWVLEQVPARRRLFSQVHIEVAGFLTDYTRTRRKLLMIPVGHLKTTFGSHGLPLHVIIQRASSNIYFPGEWGCDQRIVLGNESEAKCKENLQVVAENLLQNPILRWLWPEVCPNEAKPKRWTDFAIQVPRYRIFPEPTVTAIGAETGFMGRHYTVVITDDLAGIKAGQSAQTMDRAKRTQAALRSRLDDPWRSIEVEIGTHQSADDIYSVKKKDPTVEVMCRAIEEHSDPGDVDSPILPLWPEKYPAELIGEMRRTTDPILWALWFMNKPVPSGYTALNWDDLREFRFTTVHGVEYCTFDESPKLDRLIFARYERKNMHPAMRLLTQRPQAESVMDQMRRQLRLGMSNDQSEHIRLKYSRCLDCGLIYDVGQIHDCPRKPSDALSTN